MIAAALVVAAAGTGIALGVGDSGHAVMVRPDSIVVIDPRSARAVDDLPMPIEPALLAGGGQALWATAAGTNAVVRIDTPTREIAQTYGLGGGPAIGLAADATGAWASSAPARSKVLLERFEPGSRKATETVELMVGMLFAAHRFAPLVLAGGALWASNGETTVFKIDPQSGTVRRRILVDDCAGSIGWGAGDLWAAYTLSDTVTRIDGARGRVDFAIALARPLSAPSRSQARRGAIDPSSVLFAFGSIWVGAYGIDSVVRIDPETNGVMTTIPVGDGPHALAAGAGALWVMSNRDATVTKIDPARNAVVARIRLGHTPSSIAFADGRVWVAVQTP